MNWKSFFLGIGVGIVAGYTAKEAISNCTSLSSTTVLTLVKKEYKKMAPISGSWITTEKETYEKDGLSYTVYKGGIIRTIDGKSTLYEFIADSKTGTILESSLHE